MKKLLPTIVFCVVFFATLILPSYVFAADEPTPIPTLIPHQTPSTPTEGSWVKDADVTFAGKLAARGQYFLGSMLSNYQWYFLSPASSRNSLAVFWVTVRNIVYAFFGIFILVSAFIVVISRGKNMTIMRFVPRFIGIVLLVTFSFALIQFIYQVTDIVQGFFLKDLVAGTDHLVSVFFAQDYGNFVGYRLFGSSYDESAFISLLLVKLTAITMYVMAGVLFVRKIILWFFLIISPIFPLLLLYSPVRNTGKIWLGEFLKWLLYGPLFTIFAAGIMVLWRNNLFANPDPGARAQNIYPTAINILLGGPGQLLSVANSINAPETFLLYILGLIMLWSSIILPFVLLQIFLDYFQRFQPAENTMIRQMLNMGGSFFNRPPAIKPPPPPPSIQPAGIAMPLPTGAARALPLQTPVSISNQQSNIKNNPVITSVNRPVVTTINKPITNTYQSPISNQQFTTNISQVTNSVLKTTNLSVPTMHDVARYDSSSVTNNQQTTLVNTTLEKLANPRTAETPVQREQFRAMRDQLIQEKQKGDPVAASVLTAATVASETKTAEKTQTTTATTTQKVAAVPSATFPVVNRVQSVSLEDYESVRKLWQDNYAKLETPGGGQIERKQWITEDLSKVTEAINKLQSHDEKTVKEGMNMVSSILPFLLIGGFSQTEVIAYLKAKQEAAKTTLSDLDKKKEEESTMMDREEGKQHAQAEKTMEAHAQIEPEEPKELEEKPV